MGTSLSGGQRQRLGPGARALRRTPFLVVLDEPNANLDPEGEAALTAAIEGIKARGGIAIVIAHRPSALQACDLVGVVQHGKLTAFGPKDEVLNARPATAADEAAPAAAAAAGRRGRGRTARRAASCAKAEARGASMIDVKSFRPQGSADRSADPMALRADAGERHEAALGDRRSGWARSALYLKSFLMAPSQAAAELAEATACRGRDLRRRLRRRTAPPVALAVRTTAGQPRSRRSRSRGPERGQPPRLP